MACTSGPARDAAGAPRLGAMAGPVKSEAVVLRSMRYGEADRILHLYTPNRGRVSAIAKGVRRTRSRFGRSPLLSSELRVRRLRSSRMSAPHAVAPPPAHDKPFLYFMK